MQSQRRAEPAQAAGPLRRAGRRRRPGEASERGGFTLQSRHPLSVDHIRSAAYHARAARALEREEIALPGQADYVGHRATVIAAVLCATSFVESAVNEMFEDAIDNEFALRERGLTPEGIAAIGRTATGLGDARIPALQKYQLALAVCEEEPFESDAAEFAEVRSVFWLRNRLVHYSPEWDVIMSPDEIKPLEYERRFKGKFPESPFAQQARLEREELRLSGKEVPFFPTRCLSHGCAAWAVRSVLGFSDTFHERLGITPRYEPDRAWLNPTDAPVVG